MSSPPRGRRQPIWPFCPRHVFCSCSPWTKNVEEAKKLHGRRRASLCIYGQWLVSKVGIVHLASPFQFCTQEEHTVALRTMAGRWGTECSVPVRLAPVMAHLGSYEEILAHVFHTSVLNSVTLPGEFFINTKHTPQESS